MAKVEVRRGDRQHDRRPARLANCYHADVALRGHPVTDGDVHRVLEAGSMTGARPGRTVLHSLPTGFALDATRGINDPHGMVGEKLGVDMHVVSSDQNAVRNLMLAGRALPSRCRGRWSRRPMRPGLAALVDDEAEMGAVVIDLGGGTTSMGVFAGGHFVHTDSFAVGGNHVTMDIARGLSTTVAHAERLKTLYGSTITSASDDRETIAVASVDEDERDAVNHVPSPTSCGSSGRASRRSSSWCATG